MLLNHTFIFPWRSVCCVLLLFFIGTPRIIYKSVRMQRCWPLIETPRFSCTKKNKRLFYTLKRKSKGKIENRYFQNPLPKEIVTIMVISSTLVNTTFLIKHFHECQHNCVRFNLRYKQGTLFCGEKRQQGEEKKDRISVGKIIYWVVNSWICIALFHNFWKVHFLHILCFKYGKLFVQRSVLDNSRQLLSFSFEDFNFRFRDEMNVSVQNVDLQTMMRNSVVACSLYRAFLCFL